MNKERIKSIILILLIIVNLMLAENILVDKKLWPSGYNFFNMGNVSRKSSFSLTKQLTVPEKIIINTGYQSSRFEYLRTSSEFSEIHSAVEAVLKKAFMQPQKNVQSVLSDNWYSALTSKSIYLSYPCSFSAQNFAALSGITSELGFSGFSDIVISENGQVYINDSAANSFYKIDVSSGEISPIIQKAADEHFDDQSVINYSFEMNFDKDFGDQRTFLSPMIPIYSDPIPAEVFVSSNPVVRESGTNQKVISGILTAFSINPNTMRRYTEADGSLVFVENNGILKISPDGILTFTASDNGIRLSESSSDNTYSNVSKIAEFIDTVNAAAGAGIDMLLTSSLTSDAVQTFTFDYTAGGMPIKFDNASAVSATLENGYLTKYSQILRKYTSAGYTAYSPIYIEALDEVIAMYQDSMSQINIIKMHPAYIDDLSIGEKTPDWFIGIDNILAE